MTALSSIRNTGKTMVKTVTAKLGGRFTSGSMPTRVVSTPPAVFGAPTGTQRAASGANSGPQTITVGTATRIPKIKVSPSGAPTAWIAISGPGCGGTRPCSTESPASAGIAIRINLLPERWATRTITGNSSTRPISKNIGRPMMTATKAIIQGTLAPETLASRVSTTLLAPPESAINLPSIAPKPISRPTSCNTEPTPAS